MARIEPVTLETAPESARPALAGLAKAFGRAPNLFATFGQSGPALSGLLAHQDTLTKNGSLTVQEIELINLRTSELNGCAYCVSAHTVIGKMNDLPLDVIEAGRRGLGRNVREQAILDLVGRVVRTGGAGAGTELAAARAAGVTDAEVVEVLSHTALKQLTNALAIVAQTDIDFPKPSRLPSL
jgi:uncharacterized peroxidase-related enzyme